MYWPASIARRDLPGTLPTFGHLPNGWHPDVSLRVIKHAGASGQQFPAGPMAKESALPRCLAVSNAIALDQA